MRHRGHKEKRKKKGNGNGRRKLRKLRAKPKPHVRKERTKLRHAAKAAARRKLEAMRHKHVFGVTAPHADKHGKPSAKVPRTIGPCFDRDDDSGDEETSDNRVPEPGDPGFEKIGSEGEDAALEKRYVEDEGQFGG